MPRELLWIVVDTEANGPYPNPYSMVGLGAVALTKKLDKSFLGWMKPDSDEYVPEALSSIGLTHEQTLAFRPAAEVLEEFAAWLVAVCGPGRHPQFVSDNPAFDFQFVNNYCWRYLGRNPFGWSGRRIGDLYCGLQKDVQKRWKKLRTTVHDHNPMNDARGNAEALIKMRDMGLWIPIPPA